MIVLVSGEKLSLQIIDLHNGPIVVVLIPPPPLASTSANGASAHFNYHAFHPRWLASDQVWTQSSYDPLSRSYNS